jgi:hypothetical protein
VRLANWYVDRLHLAAHRDPVVATAFQRVVNMLTPPTTLMSPRLAIRIVCRNIQRSRSERHRREASLNPPTTPSRPSPQGHKVSNGSGARDNQPPNTPAARVPHTIDDRASPVSQ